MSLNTDSSILAFDLGATSGRAILGTLRRGELSIDEVHRFPNDPVSHGGGVRWDVEALWQEMRTGMAKAARDSATPPVSVGVDTWGVDYALLGKDGALLEKPYHYRDRRTAGQMEKALAILGAERVHTVTGVQFMPINTLYQLYAAAQNTPALLESARALVTIPDLLNYWLTGTIACEYTNATTTQFFDRRTRSWACELLNDLGIPTHFLQRIVNPGTVLGGLRRELTFDGALARTSVTVPACHDTGSAVAAVRTGGSTAFLSSGTWSLLGTEVPEAVVNEASYRLNFTNEGGVGGAYRLLKNITGLWLLEGCKKIWDAEGRVWTYSELMAMAQAAEPLAVFLDPDDPSFAAPEDMTRAIRAFCAMSGQCVPSSPGAYVRAILESLALKYRFVLDQLTQVAGAQFKEIRIIGGGCRNSLLNQFTAEATQCRVLAGPAEATALGNIAMQLVGIGAVAGINEARNLIERSFPVEVFEPNANGEWNRAYRQFQSLSPR